LHSYYSIPNDGLASLPVRSFIAVSSPGSTQVSPTPVASPTFSVNSVPSISNQVYSQNEFNTPARTISPNPSQLAGTTGFGPLDRSGPSSSIPVPGLSAGSTSRGDQSQITTPQFELNSPPNFGSQNSPPRGQSTHPCALCNQEFERQYMLNQHHKRIHDKQFVCQVANCPQEPFGLKKDLLRHQTSRHPSLYPPISFKCPFGDCPSSRKGFPRKDNLQRHIREQHE
jgi:hypothetical protein